MEEYPARSCEDSIQHGFGEPARQRILLAWVVGTKQRGSGCKVITRAMCKTRFWLGKCLPLLTQRLQCLVKGKLPKGDDDAHLNEQTDFTDKKRQTVIRFFGERPIVRRSAADSGTDVTVDELQSVFPVRRSRLIGEAGAVERPKQPVAAPVAGEEASGAVAAMRRWRQSDNKQLRLWVAKARDGPAPVGFCLEAADFLLRHMFPPGHQTGTAPAGNDVLAELFEYRQRCLAGKHGRFRRR